MLCAQKWSNCRLIWRPYCIQQKSTSIKCLSTSADNVITFVLIYLLTLAPSYPIWLWYPVRFEPTLPSSLACSLVFFSETYQTLPLWLMATTAVNRARLELSI